MALCEDCEAPGPVDDNCQCPDCAATGNLYTAVGEPSARYQRERSPVEVDEYGRELSAHCEACGNHITALEAEDHDGLCDVCADAGEAECTVCGRWISRAERDDLGRCIRCDDPDAPR